MNHESISVRADSHSKSRIVTCSLLLIAALVCNGCRFTAGPDEEPVSVQAQWPAWSPDGNFVAYWAAPTNAEPEGIYILDLRDSTRRWMSTGITPDWDPTGKKLVVSLEGGGLCVLSVDQPDSAKMIYVGEAFSPAWSPSGEWIAFDKVIDSVKGIWVTRADGGGETRRITRAGIYARAPDWSPDGKHILCAARVSGHTKDVCVVDVESGDIEALTRTDKVDEQFPRWDPSGTQVVYCGSDGIYLLPQGGREPHRLPGTYNTRLHREQSASWSPSGTRLVYNMVELWIMNVDGTANHEVVVR